MAVQPPERFTTYSLQPRTEWNSTKLDRRQVLNILHQVCVFPAHYQHVFHYKKKYSGAGLWPCGPVVTSSVQSEVY